MATGLLLATVALAGCSVSALPSDSDAEPALLDSPVATDTSPSPYPASDEPMLSPSAEASMSPTPTPTRDAQPSPTPEPEPAPTPERAPSPKPTQRVAPSSSPTPTPWPFAAITGIGHIDGRPFTIDVWIDHDGGAHGFFDGSVGSPEGPRQVAGAVTCARIDGNIGVFGGQTDWTDFVAMVSDHPNGMIIGTGRPGCDTTGFGDPATSPTTDGDIHVIPGP